MAHIERTYENAIKIIDSRQRQARPNRIAPKFVPEQNASPDVRTPDLRGTPSIVGMAEWLRMLGHSDEAINALNVIHVAGTKGKGSTCAFTESFLRAHGQRTGFPRKTGMYTSPHLMEPEERIRINSLPLPRARFAEYFFEVYDKLPQLKKEYDPSRAVVERGPRFLQLYALLAFHVFVREGVDVAVIETHSGGEYDATNVVTRPVVTAVTSLGMDHVIMLGPRIEDIAWHKAGIFKKGSVALSTMQDRDPADVLVERAKDVGSKLAFIDIDPRLPKDMIQLKPSVQKKNASLAIAAANALLDLRATPPGSQFLTKDDIRIGVQQWHWPGRFEVFSRNSQTWFLDAAHNDMSVRIAAEWFAESSRELQESKNPDVTPSSTLIFTHINELRDAVSVLESLADALNRNEIAIGDVIFTSYAEADAHGDRGRVADYEAFRAVWERFYPNSRIWIEPLISRAIDRAGSISKIKSDPAGHVLVTGSQHLVGPALKILKER